MIEFHISPSGNDDNTGSSEAPFKSLEQARKKVREIIQNFTDKKEDITVHLAAGTHRLTETLIIEAEDSGDGEFTVNWQGSENANTEISSAYALDNWQRCEGLADIPKELEGKIWYTDLPEGTSVNTLYSRKGPVPVPVVKLSAQRLQQYATI